MHVDTNVGPGVPSYSVVANVVVVVRSMMAMLLDGNDCWILILRRYGVLLVASVDGGVGDDDSLSIAGVNQWESHS